MVGGKRISNDVQVSEKYVINFRLEVRNKGGHSSMPVPDNAIYHLAARSGPAFEIRFPPEDQRSDARLFPGDVQD